MSITLKTVRTSVTTLHGSHRHGSHRLGKSVIIKELKIWKDNLKQ